MILTRLLKNIFGRGHEPMQAPTHAVEDERPRVLNVGGGSKAIAIPAYYAGWNHLLLDIAANPGVDVVLDARQLGTLAPEQFDAIYCSHNLEHYFRHDCDKVLAGMMHTLKPEGYLELAVPNMKEVFHAVVSRQLDIDDVLYVSGGAGPITVHDVVYGLGSQIESSGVDFYAHKRGFTEKSLMKTLQRAGFKHIEMKLNASHLEIGALAFKSQPTAGQKALFGI